MLCLGTALTSPAVQCVEIQYSVLHTECYCHSVLQLQCVTVTVCCYVTVSYSVFPTLPNNDARPPQIPSEPPPTDYQVRACDDVPDSQIMMCYVNSGIIHHQPSVMKIS